MCMHALTGQKPVEQPNRPIDLTATSLQQQLAEANTRAREAESRAGKKEEELAKVKLKLLDTTKQLSAAIQAKTQPTVAPAAPPPSLTPSKRSRVPSISNQDQKEPEEPHSKKSHTVDNYTPVTATSSSTSGITTQTSDHATNNLVISRLHLQAHTDLREERWSNKFGIVHNPISVECQCGSISTIVDIFDEY